MNTGFLLFALHLPERRMFNEWYARDISKKRRISNKIKGNGGEPMGQPPYGYMKDPDNPKHWIVDDEAAQVVKHIYGMTLDGMGTEQIAAQLEREEILTPRAYWLKKGVKRPGKGKQQPPTKWNSSTVTKILSLQEYCGDILNFKTYSKSYKNKKRIENDRENWVVFKDVHERLLIAPCGSRFSRNGAKSASAEPTRARRICFPACWSVPIAETTCISTSIRETRRSDISTVPIIRATAAPAPLPIMSGWIFSNRWC